MRFSYSPWLFFFMLLLPLYGNAQQEKTAPAHLDTALTYVGLEETDRPNYGPEINRFLASTGLPPGNPYCAAFVSYSLNVARQTVSLYPNCPELTNHKSPIITQIVDLPRKRTALAQDFITKNSIEAKRVARGSIEVPAGSIMVMKKGNTRFGHTGLVREAWRGSSGKTIEANTSSGAYGNQRDGEGIWKRERTIWPTNHFRVSHFTLVTYKNAQ